MKTNDWLWVASGAAIFLGIFYCLGHSVGVALGLTRYGNWIDTQFSIILPALVVAFLVWVVIGIAKLLSATAEARAELPTDKQAAVDGAIKRAVRFFIAKHRSRLGVFGTILLAILK